MFLRRATPSGGVLPPNTPSGGVLCTDPRGGVMCANTACGGVSASGHPQGVLRSTSCLFDLAQSWDLMKDSIAEGDLLDFTQRLALTFGRQSLSFLAFFFDLI
ncbi:hypothetical protein Taro_017105 [Colocasia esculenta]|uniref:Uncharacterized protein n=1 Tax=Colocasia esculenta TaxID=4460 RepID=A0A843UQA7_COLES|nr:hypothetical protein [Colocasia esculenta]